MIYIGIDNGVSGSVAWVRDDASCSETVTTPTFSEQDYTQKAKNVTRVHCIELRNIFKTWRAEWLADERVNCTARVFLERPMVNPGRFMATASALRAWEATLIALGNIWPRFTLDSRKWQKAMLPIGIKGAEELKRASVTVGCRIFPQHAEWIKKHGDADALLIAEYARREKL